MWHLPRPYGGCRDTFTSSQRVPQGVVAPPCLCKGGRGLFVSPLRVSRGVEGPSCPRRWRHCGDTFCTPQPPRRALWVSWYLPYPRGSCNWGCGAFARPPRGHDGLAVMVLVLCRCQLTSGMKNFTGTDRHDKILIPG